MGEAKQSSLNLIELLPAKLSPTGVVLYWNTGLKADDDDVVRAFRERGLPNYRAGIWSKKSQAPMIQNSPQTTTFERFLIQSRQTKIRSYDFEVSRDNLIVMDDTPVCKSSKVYHMMQKPESLIERFLRQYCPPNSLVFDAFGCSGSACVAARSLGHRYVYCELDKENYEFDAGRIAEHEEALKSVVA